MKNQRAERISAGGREQTCFTKLAQHRALVKTPEVKVNTMKLETGQIKGDVA